MHTISFAANDKSVEVRLWKDVPGKGAVYIIQWK
jgi:hypothetical protein